MSHPIEDMLNEHFKNEQATPAEGHERRFEDRLTASPVPGKSRWIMMWPLLAAASLALVFVFNFNQNAEEPEGPGIATDPRIIKAEEHFAASLDRNWIPSESDDPVIAELTKELAFLDAEHQKLKEKSDNDPLNPLLIEAIINNLQLRLQITLRIRQYSEYQSKSLNS
jgi:hypothetical protein